MIKGFCLFFVLLGVTFAAQGDKEEVMRGYYEKSGKLKYEIPYKNGKKNGVMKGYYESGKLKYEIPYKDDKQSGQSVGYYENGSVKYRK